ncbi:MAG: hypothetical protein IJD49_05460 [Clostridia bacterium]|nr:hypothetical protein [Clostridia bacterium]
MKISLSSVVRTLAALNLFLPVCTAVCFIFGYRFSLFNYTVCSIILGVISVAGVVFSFITKEKNSKKSDTAMLALLPLLSVINWTVYLFKSPDKTVVTVCLPICFVCAIIISIKYIKPTILKIASVVTPSLALFPITFISFLLLLPVAKNTVVKTVPSPNGTYCAEVTDSDQGALGGDTLVHIHETKKLDFLIFNIAKAPNRIYTGDWKEHETMRIYWKNEHSLMINENEYTIE